MNILHACLIILVYGVFNIISCEPIPTPHPIDTISRSTQAIYLNDWQITKDGDPKNDIPDYPDSSWTRITPSLDLDSYKSGNWVIRTSFTVKDSLRENAVFGMFIFNIITAYEIYWDKVIIAKNGQLGNNYKNEIAGINRYNIIIPHNLMIPGNHEIMIRISNHNNISPWNWNYGYVVLGKVDFIMKDEALTNYKSFFVLGILFVAFIFNLFLYLNRKKIIEHLLFSIVCFLIILDYFVFIIPKILSFPTTYIHFEYYFYQVNTLLFITLFPTFLIYTFALSKRIVGIIIIINLSVYYFFTNILNLFEILSFTLLIISSAITIWAIILRRKESVLIAISLLLSWAAFYFNFAFAMLSTTMVICTSFYITKQFAKNEKAEREAQLRSVRLENELLKKNINPHFVLNTLTSIIAWLRKDPSSAIKLIEALAEEFRMINQVSSLKLIPITQEIELCKAHLKIMSYRKGADYKLETIDIDENDTIPPMIIHTLIENGLTHGFENKTNGTFRFKSIKNLKSITYIIQNDGDFDEQDTKGSIGFGAKYIKGRLEESYSDRWKFTSNKLTNGWETIIEIEL